VLVRRRRLVFVPVALATSCTLLRPLDRYNRETDLDAAPADDTVVAPGDAGPDAPLDAGPSWNRYTYATQTGRWGSPERLADIWTGPNAPPSHGIESVIQLADPDLDRVLVFADNGLYYVQASGVWQTPVETRKAWAPFSGTAPKGSYHVPWIFGILNNPNTAHEDTITLVDNPSYFNYSYKQNDAIVSAGSGPMQDEPSPGPPQATGRILWAYEVITLDAAPADRYVVNSLYEDGNLYSLNAALTWMMTPIRSSPYWQKPGAPAAPMTLRAAYFDHNLRTLHVIGP
jgi:hypothetical protein